LNDVNGITVATSDNFNGGNSELCGDDGGKDWINGGSEVGGGCGEASKGDQIKEEMRE